MIRKGLDKHNGIYQDRTTQPHLHPLLEYQVLLFPVGLGCLRLDSRNFVNRRLLRSIRVAGSSVSSGMTF